MCAFSLLCHVTLQEEVEQQRAAGRGGGGGGCGGGGGDVSVDVGSGEDVDLEEEVIGLCSVYRRYPPSTMKTTLYLEHLLHLFY